MPGVKGMVLPRKRSTRNQLWQSIRILRRFSIPDLLRTVPTATLSNTRKLVQRLEAHGYLRKTGRYTGGRAGEYQGYALADDSGINVPTVCARCGKTLAVEAACQEVTSDAR